MSPEQVKTNVGKRVLLKEEGCTSAFDELHEVTIVEATSRNVKLRYPSGTERWFKISDTDKLEEVLP